MKLNRNLEYMQQVPLNNKLIANILCVWIMFVNCLDGIFTFEFIKNKNLMNDLNPIIQELINQPIIFLIFKMIMVPSLCFYLLCKSDYKLSRIGIYFLTIIYTTIMLIWYQCLLIN